MWWFGVLGPIEVRGAGGQVVPVGGPRLRALLALLLLDAGRVVGTDRLIDGVWGTDPPAGDVGNALQSQVSRLRRALGEPPGFGITLDVGHCRCLEPLPVPDCVAAVAPYLVNVQIDDMRRGTHEHLEFGTGEIDFPPVLAALAAAGYPGLVAVELPRHSHAAPTVARDSLTFLRTAADRSGTPVAGRHRTSTEGEALCTRNPTN
ncbi:TIM barrel protein [Micromonospora zhanjiangensis]